MAYTRLSFDNPVFAAYTAYAGLVVLKMTAVAVCTTYMRFSRGVFNNPEDLKAPVKNAVLRLDHPDVERVRRLHRNDLENIPMFLAVGLLYVLTGPSPGVALWHFRVFTAARYLHTVCYLAALQPGRALCYTVGFFVTLSMTVQVLMTGTL